MVEKNKKKILIATIIIALALNTCTFIAAYPQTFKPLSSTYAADFSAYYIGEWRLFHNPAQIYNSGDYIQGDIVILPKPQTFMYTPSFLIFFSPILTLSYQNALNIFDILQVLSVFALAFFVYKLVKDKKPVLGCVAAIVILLLPIPNLVDFQFSAFFQSYYWGYAMANAHVIQASLIVGALYFGVTKKPWISAFLVAVSSFDPRVTLLALPLLVWYNRGNLRKFIVGSIALITAFNLPFFFYYNIGASFVQSKVTGHIASLMYAYDWIPMVAAITLTIVEVVSIVESKKKLNFPKIRKKATSKTGTSKA